jgi:hypothetical protein
MKMRTVDYSQLKTRRCADCKKIKDVSEFNKHRAKKAINGWRYYSYCKKCQHKQNSLFYSNNRPRRNKYLSEWRKTNPMLEG